MDPSSIPPPSVPPPTAVPFPAEPNDHPPPPDPPANHPPYAEMIYTAIEALKEKNGSSKRAIGKYIEQVYKDQLPPNHSTLLTHHLNRLKTTGLLQMVKKSYALPRSAPLPGLAPQPLPPGGSPRPRGRPRKAQNPVHNLPQAQPLPLPLPLPLPQETANVQQNAEPVWAALGLADEPLQAESGKKRPGRPKKNAVPGAGPSRRGRPPGSVKRPGRPPKAKTDTAEASVGPKRGPGRPPKNQTQATPIPFAQPAGADPVAEPVAAAADAGAVLGPRARGRPKKYADEVVAAGRGRGRGRGRGGRGRGRGRGGLPAPPRPGARPVGRPKKGSTYASTSQNAANDDLRRKLEHFQSKVKESLAVLKPHFNHESPATAIAAIQDLEELGIMDLNAPLRDETLPHQEELPPPQPPVQPQQLQLPRQQLPPPPQQQQQPPQQNLPPQQLPPQAPIFPQDFPAFHLQPFQQHLQFQQQQQPQPPQLFQPPPQHHQQFHP